ncbi:hypothetical protein M569_11231 [Genlisea aurea]|uniref:phosphoribosylglycinamide formyltransferase 1 n=1 Tax=Genlisea aurea TaxID=192259 RepID=S8DUH2_9LAMI|nr:hypothetical protein M569_11231 [Genlisea aurea]
MEAQHLFLRGSFRGCNSSIQCRKTLFAPISLPFSSRRASRKWIYTRSSQHRGSVKKDEYEEEVLDAEKDKAKKKAQIARKNLAVFVSGGGSNFRSIYEATQDGTVHGDVKVLVTNKLDCGGAEFARSEHIPVIIFPGKSDPNEAYRIDDLIVSLRSYEVDFILLAGYLKLIPNELIKTYPKSIFNIHPSLLPAFGGKGFYGMKVHRAVIASGARYSGATVHCVDEEYDRGRIVAQRVVPVLATDTAEELAGRVLQEVSLVVYYGSK